MSGNDAMKAAIQNGCNEQGNGYELLVLFGYWFMIRYCYEEMDSAKLISSRSRCSLNCGFLICLSPIPAYNGRHVVHIVLHSCSLVKIKKLMFFTSEEYHQ